MADNTKIKLLFYIKYLSYENFRYSHVRNALYNSFYMDFPEFTKLYSVFMILLNMTYRNHIEVIFTDTGFTSVMCYNVNCMCYNVSCMCYVGVVLVGSKMCRWRFQLVFVKTLFDIFWKLWSKLCIFFEDIEEMFLCARIMNKWLCWHKHYSYVKTLCL